MLKKGLIVAIIIGLMLTAFSTSAMADYDYPEETITWIVPWSAGGGTDLITRQIASQLEDRLGVPIMVENREGGGGLVGIRHLAAQEPDGYTIASQAISAMLQKALGMDHQCLLELTLISQYNEDPAGVTVNSDAEWDNIHDFVEFARENPGELQLAHSGTGASWHVAGIQLEEAIGAEFDMVPYEGGRPAATSVAGNHTDVTTTSIPEVAPLVHGEDLKILAVMGADRHPHFPDVPTMQEEGYDVTAGTWRGIFAPAGTPDYVVETIDNEIKEIVESDAYKQFMEDQGFGILYRGPEEFREWLEEHDEELHRLLEDVEV